MQTGMITETVAWSDITTGDTVLGKDGTVWEITGRSDDTFVFYRPGKKAGARTMPLDEQVQRVTSVLAERDAAIEVLGQVGAVVLHVEGEDTPPACPPEYDHPGALLSHLYLLHGVRFDGTAPESTLTELIDLHRKAHDQRGDGYVHHHHTPDYLKVNQ